MMRQEIATVAIFTTCPDVPADTLALRKPKPLLAAEITLCTYIEAMVLHYILLISAFIIAGPGWIQLALAHATTVVITITEEGYSPPEVTVDEQTVVNFANKDTAPHWPASDPHPIHDGYSEFDPKKPIPPGDIWIFKPTRVGTWRYHDHLNPHRKGTITVTAELGSTVQSEAEEAARNTSPSWIESIRNAVSRVWGSIVSFWQRNKAPEKSADVEGVTTTEFKELSEDEQYKYLASYAEEKGLPAAWEFVKTNYTNSEGASLGGRAHDLAHYLGGLIYKEKGLSGLTICDTMFAFGCYHGFTGMAFATSLDPLLDVAKACEVLGPVSSGPWASCIHGIGHGVATYFNSTKLTDALATCDSLPEGQTYCHDGVFMEFAISAPPGFYKASDVLAPCTTIETKYQSACARNQPHVMERRHQMSRPAIAHMCSTAEPSIAHPCLDSIGFAIANESEGKAEVITARCYELPPETQAACLTAAAVELIFQNYPGWQSTVPTLCRSIPTEFQQGCFERTSYTQQQYQRN